jgi:SAM-dependent methyltransferase
MRYGPGVDSILDLHDLGLLGGSVGTALMLDTLEHVEFPRKAIENVKRILKPDGILIMSSVMNFPIHDFPYDYWRFTPEAFKSLLKVFKVSFVEAAGRPEFPHTIIGIGLKEGIAKESSQKFVEELMIWKERWTEKAQPWWKRIMKSFVPPLIVSGYMRLRKTKLRTL